MRGQLVDVDRRFDVRPGAGDRGSVGCQERDLRRRDRLQRLGQGRGDRQPAYQHEEQHGEAAEQARHPPAPAAARLRRWLRRSERAKPIVDRLAPIGIEWSSIGGQRFAPGEQHRASVLQG
jgi:hypothetical protein